VLTFYRWDRPAAAAAALDPRADDLIAEAARAAELLRPRRTRVRTVQRDRRRRSGWGLALNMAVLRATLSLPWKKGVRPQHRYRLRHLWKVWEALHTGWGTSM